MPARGSGDLPLSRAETRLARPSSASAHAPADVDLGGLIRAIVVGLVASCLVLQRFGVPVGAKSISVVGPIGFVLMGFGMLRGAVAIDRQRLVALMVLTLLAIAGLYAHVTYPGNFSAAPELSSLLQFLLLSAFAVFSFTQALPEEAFFRLVNNCLAIVAVAGLLQFALQTVGLALFSFRGLVPAGLLFEDGYNLIIPLGYGALFKANGFFMLEPSIFSQFMALGLIIEVLTARRVGIAVLLLLALLSSASGTGWIVLASFLISAGFTMGLRGVATAAVVGTVVVAVLAGVAVLQPQFAATLADRLDEVTRQGTSGHLRFVTPFWLLSDIVSRQPQSLLFGLGAGVSERLMMPYEFTVNTPVKIIAEYGVPALLVYVLLFLLGHRTHIQRALTAPALVLLLLTGGYQQFPPILFFILLLLCVARLAPAPPPARAG